MKNQKILLTTSIVIIVAIIVIFILFVVGNDAKNKESNFGDNIITSDQVYEMYISINPIVKISFKERYLKCENEELNNKCNLSTEITEYELVNDDAKDIYKDIDFYEKDIIEVIPKMVDAVNNSNINFTTINIITNWNGVYNESLVSNAIEENSILGKEYNVNINVTESIDNNSILNQQVISRRDEKKHILVLNAEAMEEKELTMHLLDSINTEYAVEVFGSEELINNLDLENIDLYVDLNDFKDLNLNNDVTGDYQAKLYLDIDEDVYYTIIPNAISISLTYAPKRDMNDITNDEIKEILNKYERSIVDLTLNEKSVTFCQKMDGKFMCRINSNLTENEKPTEELFQVYDRFGITYGSDGFPTNLNSGWCSSKVFLTNCLDYTWFEI